MRQTYKTYILILLLILGIITCFVVDRLGNSDTKELELKDSIFRFSYGETIPLEPEFYLRGNAEETLLYQIDISTDSEKPARGSYKGIVKKDGEALHYFIIEVE